MRRPLVMGNWKLNGNKESNAALINGLKGHVAGVDTVTMAVCPPAMYLAQVAELVADSGIAFGSQDVSEHTSGAYTGELAGPMVKEMGAAYALVGHSERRTYHGETDEIIARKFKAAQEAGLVPVLCIGETLEERDGGKLEAVIRTQVEAVINAYGIEAYANAVIAYEPVWAIGTGRTATSEQAQEVHAFIRQLLAGYDADIAAKLQILYGGSVKAATAEDLFGQPDIDGALVGGAALIADEFGGIFKHAAASV